MELVEPAVQVRDSPLHGRGVFTTRPIELGERFVVDPVFRIDAAERPHLDQTALHDHYFEHDLDAYLALGPSTLLNHDDDPNADFELDVDALEISLVARRPIEKGEEVTIHYGVEPWW